MNVRANKTTSCRRFPAGNQRSVKEKGKSIVIISLHAADSARTCNRQSMKERANKTTSCSGFPADNWRSVREKGKRIVIISLHDVDFRQAISGREGKQCHFMPLITDIEEILLAWMKTDHHQSNFSAIVRFWSLKKNFRLKTTCQISTEHFLFVETNTALQ